MPQEGYMSDTTTTPTPADVAAKVAPQEPTPEPAAAAPEATPAPPWGDDFDPEKAWSLIQNLRADKERLSKRELPADVQQKITEYDRLVEASKTELERAQEAAQSNEQRAQSLLNRAVKAEVKALASGFADPEDAAAFLDLQKYATADGDVDTEAIRGDLADLLAKKPHLGKLPESRVPAPNPAQGSSGSGAGEPAQYDAEWVLRASREGRHEDIVKARAEGRLANYLKS